MAAVGTLSAGAPQGRLHFRHRRLLVSRHHARRRHADHRDGGHERLPQGTAGQDPRPQRPSAGAAAGIAADRLEGCRRPHQPGRRASGSPRRWWTARRWGRRRSTRPACSFAAFAPTISTTSPRSPRTSSRARSRASTTGRASPSAAGSPINCRCMPATASRWCRRRGAVTPMGTTPRIKPYKVAAVFEIGMSEYDFELRVHAAAGGAGLFQPQQRRHRDRGVHRPIPTRSTPSARP